MAHNALKPPIFIGSSAENLELAYAVSRELASDTVPVVWSRESQLTVSILQNLFESLDTAHYGVFVVAGEDLRSMRGKRQRVPRDNVIFEIGLFLGRLGPRRTFIVRPESDVSLPSDLKGIIAATYDVDVARDNPRKAVVRACDRIRKAIRESPVHRSRYVIPGGDVEAIRAYMYEWIKHGGRVAIFSRDMTWAGEPEMKRLLVSKAKKGELLICLPNRIPLMRSFPDAEFHVYQNLDHYPSSRFTIVQYGKDGARVAVGRAQGDDHVIEEFSAGDHPAFYMAHDLVNFVIRFAEKGR